MCTACVILYYVNQPLTKGIQIGMISKSNFFGVVCDSLKIYKTCFVSDHIFDRKYLLKVTNRPNAVGWC